MEPVEATVVSNVNNPGSRIDQNEENLQSTQEHVSNSSDDANNVIDTDVSVNPREPAERAYYVNVHDIDGTDEPQTTLLDSEAVYASVNDTGVTERQTDTVVISAYAIGNETRDTDRQTDNFTIAEADYASVDVINENCQIGPSVSCTDTGEKNKTVSDTHDSMQTPDPLQYAKGPTEYAVVVKNKKSMKRKKSKKTKTKEADVQKNPVMFTEVGYASVDVINDNFQTGPLASGHSEEHSNSVNDTQAYGQPADAYAKGPIEYAVVDKNKKSKKTKTKEADVQKNPAMFTEAGYAYVDVIYDTCHNDPSISGPYIEEYSTVSDKRGSQEENTIARQSLADDNLPNTEVRVDYAVVDKGKKDKDLKGGEGFTEACYASVGDVLYDYCQDNPSVSTENSTNQQQQQHQQQHNPTVEYAVVKKKKK
jgi:hypothetical protein